MVYCPNPDCLSPHNPAQDHLKKTGTANFCQACGSSLILLGESGQYRLISLLGKGGFGRTFLAESLNSSSSRPSSSKCVIKQLYRKIGSDNTDLNKAVSKSESFQAEANQLRKLGKHPQIPRLLDSLENELGQFLVQEFAPGANLQQQVEDKGPWDEAAVRSLLISLVKVLQYVHSFGIIHRDIKPENIVAPVAASGIQPMLVDFGSAKWIRQTPAQTVIGSAGYASPEQSMGQATFASDIYSLGLTCLYLLTGVHPFQLYSAGEDRWVWQDYLSEPLEPRLVQVLDQMVARSLQQRYASADQVALDLQGSQNFLLGGAQQIFSQAREIVGPSLKSLGLKKRLTEKLLNVDSGAVLEKLNSSRRSLQSLHLNAQSKKSAAQIAAQVAAQRIAPATKQRWVRMHRLAPDMGLTQAIAISSNTQFFATGGSDGSLRLWQLSTATLLHTFPRRRMMGTGHGGVITALAIHPDNRVLYSASEDGTIKEWDVANRQLLNTIPVTGWTPTSLAVTPDGTQLIGANQDGKIIVWDIASLLPIAQLTQHQSSVNATAVASLWNSAGDRVGDVLASASDDGTVKLWRSSLENSQSDAEQQTLQLARTLNIRKQTAQPIQAQKDKKSRPSSAISAPRSAIRSDIRAVSVLLYPLSYSAYRLVIGSSDGAVWLYELDEALTISEPVCLHRFSQPIRTMAVSATHCLAVGTDDRLLSLWQLDCLAQVAELSHGWGVSAIAFTPDGKKLITASDDETISVWRLDSAVS